MSEYAYNPHIAGLDRVNDPDIGFPRGLITIGSTLIWSSVISKMLLGGLTSLIDSEV